MITITIQFKDSSDTPSFVCNNDDLTLFLNFLENSPSVKAYKICPAGIGMLTKLALKYNYSGFMSPNGKAVEKFDWTNSTQT